MLGRKHANPWGQEKRTIQPRKMDYGTLASMLIECILQERVSDRRICLNRKLCGLLNYLVDGRESVAPAVPTSFFGAGW